MKKFTAALPFLLLLCFIFSACTSEFASSPDDKNNNASVTTAEDLSGDFSAENEESTAFETARQSDTEEKSTAAKKVHTDTEKSSSKANTASSVTSKRQNKTTLKASQSNSTAAASSQESKSDSSTGAAQKANTASSSSTYVITTAKTTTASNVTSKSTTKSTTTVSSTVTATSSSSARITCTVKIECGKILDNMDSLKAGHADFVPDNGIILNTYEITMPSGSTAYEALKTACDDNNIKLSARNTIYGIYVCGINNLDEKDCGKSSGWLYSVNDIFPGKSCGYYKLSNGDAVVFSYTC